MSCRQIQGLSLALGYGYVLNGTYCDEGSAVIRNCPTGFFCPSGAEKIVCPKGWFCPMKSSEPDINCTLCPEGSMKLHRELYSFAAFIIAVIAFVGFFYVVRIVCRMMLDSISTGSACPPFTDDGDEARGEVPVSMRRRMSVLFKFEGISVYRRSFQNGKRSKEQVLNNVSGVIQPQRLCAILGESGVGKSTLLNVLSGQVPLKDSTIDGTIVMNGTFVSAKRWLGSSNAKNLIGFVPQENLAYDELTVIENLYWSGRFQLPMGTKDKEVGERARSVLGSLGLLDVMNRCLLDISGGERRRCCIGIALMGEPRVLIIDEPTSGLSASSSMSVMGLIAKLAKEQNMTIICSIHQPRKQIFSFFDDVVLLGKGGNVIYNGDARMAKPYFKHLGFRCPQDMNPADFLLDLSTGILDRERNTVDVEGQLMSRSLSTEWEIYVEKLPPRKIVGGEQNASVLIRKRPSLLIQFYYQVRRNISVLRCNYRTFWINTFVICLGSIMISWLQGPTMIAIDAYEHPLTIKHFTSQDFPFVDMFRFTTQRVIHDKTFFAAKVSSITGVLISLASCKSVSDKKPVVFREVNSGFSITAYLLALSSMSIVEHGFQMILAGTLSYWLRVPLQPLFPYVFNFFMLQWGMISWGHLLTVLVPPDNLTVIVGTAMMCSSLLCSGISKPITTEAIYSSDFIAVIAGFLSPSRYFVETYTVSDFRCLGEQYGFSLAPSQTKLSVTSMDFLHLAMTDQSTRFRECGGWYYGAIRMFFVGLTIRVFTLLLIRVSYKQENILRCRLEEWSRIEIFQRGLLILFFAILVYISINLVIT